MQSAQNESPLEQSWIYAFCIRCRGEDNRASWEPPYWQKCCPYPLCPSFRQCARMLCIVLIGENLSSGYKKYIAESNQILMGIQSFRCRNRCMADVVRYRWRYSCARRSIIRFGSADGGRRFWWIFNVIDDIATIDRNAYNRNTVSGKSRSG